ncbi:TonB-dependent receptor [Winogradskyella maritima]|uniref:TonB-dependent receptor family protein n=1 Tax=Winogradskyella maritima TaxID=1517766 RepID=A0ABV8AMQ3_9FLAO|nr:TonB-dependent receptor [Winogradskyella maritima]
MVILKDDRQVSRSDANGRFSLNDFGTYKFQRSGYVTKSINIQSPAFITVELQPQPENLDAVIVNSSVIPQALKKSIVATSVISKADLERGNNINFNEALNRVPSVFMQSGALNTNRITIRGIGARNLFGTSKIRAYFKDIPLTNGNGDTTIEDFELASIGKIEIVKGASFNGFGAGLGGTIQLSPNPLEFNSQSTNAEYSFGSFGLSKYVLNYNLANQTNSLKAIYSSTKSDGYRDNNDYNRQTINLFSDHYFNDNNQISVLASYVDLKAFIPSSLSLDDFQNDPTKPAFTWGQAQGFEDSQRFIIGANWTHNYKSNLKHITSVFGSTREAYEPRPFNILEENTNGFGLRSRLLGKLNFEKTKLQYTLGGEYFKDNYTSKTFENLYQDFPVGTGSVQGDNLSNFKEKRSYYNLFTEVLFEATPTTNIVAGLNYNQTQYTLDDRFPTSEGNPYQSGEFKFNGILSPKLGVSQELSKSVTAYTNISRGFSPITLAETFLPDGQINPDLQPEIGWNYDLGLRGSILKNRLYFDVTVFRLDIENLLVSRRVAEDQFIGINAGETKHDGFEALLNWKVLNNENFKMTAWTTYTLNNFKFKSFIDGDTDFSGNELTGVPDQVFNFGVDVSSVFGIYGNINYQHVGEMPITDSNSIYSDAYNLTNLKIGFQKDILQDFNLNIFVGINNLFNEKYASQLLINARAFGNNQPRYYYPGLPINYFSGINLSYRFP